MILKWKNICLLLGLCFFLRGTLLHTKKLTIKIDHRVCFIRGRGGFTYGAEIKAFLDRGFSSQPCLMTPEGIHHHFPTFSRLAGEQFTNINVLEVPPRES